MKYRLEVTEIQHVKKLYTIEADNLDDAFELAEVGETIDEVNLDSASVTDRVVDRNSIIEIEDKPQSTGRKYFRTVVQVEVLTQDSPYEFNDLPDLDHAITYGDASGDTKVVVSEEVSEKKMEELLVKQGSDPSFFNLGDNDDEDDDGEVVVITKDRLFELKELAKEMHGEEYIHDDVVTLCHDASEIYGKELTIGEGSVVADMLYELDRDKEEKEEEQRKDEKRGLHPDQEDPAN